MRESSEINQPDLIKLLNNDISDAIDFSQNAHSGQTRDSGEPYFNHCLEVARIIYEEFGIENDKELLIAALLHDTVEDTNTSLNDIEEFFGEQVKNLVEAVSKFKTEEGKRDQADWETLKKVARHSYVDPRVLVLKLADRLHNMRDMGTLAEVRRKRKATETIDFYVPMAQSLGLWKVKSELEDLCFEILNPERYKWLKGVLEQDERSKRNFKANILSVIQEELRIQGIRGEINIRPNSLWIINRKLEEGADLENINDVYSYRIKLTTLDDCYRMIGRIHNSLLGQEIDYDRYDEFIGRNARYNGYQAIQTTAYYQGLATEFAVMTDHMEEFNNWGVVTAIQKGEKNLHAYSRKLIFLPENGRIIFLPVNANAVDVAFYLGPEIGADAATVTIDGEELPLTVFVPNGSELSINSTSNGASLLHDLLPYAQLPRTIELIKGKIEESKNDELEAQGREAVDRILEELKLPGLEDISAANSVIHRLNANDLRIFFINFARGRITKARFISALERQGVSKNALGLTTLRLKGMDQPSILGGITSLIGENGGNITRIHNDTRNKAFYIYIVVEGLTQETESRVRAEIEGDERFNYVSVV